MGPRMARAYNFAPCGHGACAVYHMAAPSNFECLPGDGTVNNTTRPMARKS